MAVGFKVVCNVCVCSCPVPRLRRSVLGTGSHGCQRGSSWVAEPLQVGCGDLATCESLPSGWTFYMFRSSEPREMGTGTRGSLCVASWPALQDRCTGGTRQAVASLRCSQSAYDFFLAPTITYSLRLSILTASQTGSVLQGCREGCGWTTKSHTLTWSSSETIGL